MEVLRKNFYIFVNSEADLDLGMGSFSVRITSDLKSLLRDWGPTSRISPVWQLRPSLPEEIEVCSGNEDPVSLWFLRGVSADFLRDELSTEDLAKLYHQSMWLSLGAHSLVLVCRDRDLDLSLLDLLPTRHVGFERWEITKVDEPNKFEGRNVSCHSPEDYSISPLSGQALQTTEAFEKASVEADDALSHIQFELYALLAVIESRAKGPYSVFADDAIKIEQLATGLIADYEAGEAEADVRLGRPEVLLTLNSGLSRMSSQALSGTSPILRTECHFWPHSLLGIGVANLALRNVTAFISKLTTEIQYDRRLYALREMAFDIKKFNLSARAGFPDFICIDPSDIGSSNNLDTLPATALEDIPKAIGDPTTPITYFARRDGFMNHMLTTSAPFPSVSGANSYQWNLGTITHEISHRILSGHLVDLIDDFLEDMASLQDTATTDWKVVMKYFEIAPATYRDYASRMIGRTLMLLHSLDIDEGDMKDAMRQPLEFFSEAE